MLLMIGSVDAQIVGGLLNNDLYKTRIKLIDEFFNRFNGREFRADILPESEDAELRNKLVLFNAGMFKSFRDSVFLEAKAFSNKIIEDSIRIHYSDSLWFAKAACHGTFKGKPVDFVLYLNIENRRNKLYKWVISRAEGELFNLTPSLEKETIMLMPDDHETNFMALHRITTEKDDLILNYRQKNFSIDQTSVFYAFVNSGLLDIAYVDNLEFLFYQVPNYVFTVSHFERDNYNAGWLISSFKKATEEEKQTFINYILRK